MYCTNCGTEINSRYCPYCGTKFELPASGPKAAINTEKEEKKFSETANTETPCESDGSLSDPGNVDMEQRAVAEIISDEKTAEQSPEKEKNTEKTKSEKSAKQQSLGGDLAFNAWRMSIGAVVSGIIGAYYTKWSLLLIPLGILFCPLVSKRLFKSNRKKATIVLIIVTLLLAAILGAVID